MGCNVFCNVFKQALHINDTQIVNCVRPISVIEQNGQVMLYYIHDPAQNTEHTFIVVGTGWDLKDSIYRMTFLDTVKCDPYVFHVFYEKG